MTIWFVIGIVILVKIYCAINIRTRILRHQKKALTAPVNEKTRKIHKKNQGMKNRTIELNQINSKLVNQKETIEQETDELKWQII